MIRRNKIVRGHQGLNVVGQPVPLPVIITGSDSQVRTERIDVISDGRDLRGGGGKAIQNDGHGMAVGLGINMQPVGEIILIFHA